MKEASDARDTILSGAATMFMFMTNSTPTTAPFSATKFLATCHSPTRRLESVIGLIFCGYSAGVTGPYRVVADLDVSRGPAGGGVPPSVIIWMDSGSGDIKVVLALYLDSGPASLFLTNVCSHCYCCTMSTSLITSGMAGTLFGSALTASGVYLPSVIMSQMELRDFHMLKVFLTASSASAYVPP